MQILNGGMSSSRVIIGLLMGEKEPFYFSPFLIFFSWLVFKNRKSAERDRIVVDSSLEVNTEKEMCSLHSFASTSFVTQWHFPMFVNPCYLPVRC